MGYYRVYRSGTGDWMVAWKVTDAEGTGALGAASGAEVPDCVPDLSLLRGERERTVTLFVPLLRDKACSSIHRRKMAWVDQRTVDG